MKKIILLLATGLGSGYSPVAPGTFGSLVGLLLYVPLSYLTLPLYLVTVLTFIILSAWVSTAAEALLQAKDCQKIVIDEVAGILVTMALVPYSWKAAILGFVLFRIFDIVKPYPARLIQDKVTGGWGVVGDDVMAGIYANIVLQVILKFWP